jgi:uncharacterized protein
MKFTLDSDRSLNTIRACSPGELRIGERVFRASLIVTPTELIEGWAPRGLEQLDEAALQPLLRLRPEILLIGSGERQRFPDPRVLAPLYAAGIGVEVMNTSAACRTYNVLVGEDRNVAAALIV